MGKSSARKRLTPRIHRRHRPAPALPRRLPTMLGNVNQVGADGSTLTYGNTGNYSSSDPYTGKTARHTDLHRDTKLSAPAQAICNSLPRRQPRGDGRISQAF